MKINENRKSLKTAALIFIDFQYQSINCYWNKSGTRLKVYCLQLGSEMKGFYPKPGSLGFKNECLNVTPPPPPPPTLPLSASGDAPCHCKLAKIHSSLDVILLLRNYRKIPENKPLQTGNAKTPPLNRPSKYKPPPGGLYLGKCPQIQTKTKQKW